MQGNFVIENSNFGDRLEEERDRLGLKKGQMAAAGNVAASTYSSYLRGERVPDLTALAAWAEAGVDPLYVALGHRMTKLLAPDEEMMLAGYRKLDVRGRAGVLALIGGLDQTKEPATTTKTRASGRAQVINGGSNNMQIGSVKTGRRKTDKPQ